MASIVYVSDKKMIEYHRLNGNQTMNFWRLSSQKKFTHFYAGDYLFFLAKGTEHRVTKEKGIIGYGKFQHSKTMTLTQMWNQYGGLNGFSSKSEFKEAVLKLSKTKTIPKSMHSLYLTEIIFFSYPIYLSEIDIFISNSLESYTYLDRHGVSATVRLLKKAQEVGIDSWQAAIDEDVNQEIFKNDLQSHVLAHCINQVFPTDAPIPKVFKRFIESKERRSTEHIKGGKSVLYDHPKREVIFAFESRGKQKEEAFYSLVGKIAAVSQIINNTQELKDIAFHYRVITDQILENDKLNILNYLGVHTEMIE